jgi:hypothetical protein
LGDVGKARYVLDHLARAGFEQINEFYAGLIGPSPPPGGDEAAVGAQRYRIDFPDVARPGRHADRLQQFPVGERPHPHRLVVGTSESELPGGVHVDGPDHRRVHAGLNDQDRLIVKLRLRRRRQQQHRQQCEKPR